MKEQFEIKNKNTSRKEEGLRALGETTNYVTNYDPKVLREQASRQ